MNIVEFEGNSSKLMKDYCDLEYTAVHSFYDYPLNSHSFSERKHELVSRVYQRENLYQYLLNYNQQFNCSDETIVQIEKLLDPSSLVVVGGQQAGVLTGPLYTIHKIITILQLAKDQEKKLGIPVVPVFWVAGEDHDFEEINHIYTIEKGKLQKRKVKQENSGKKSVTNLQLDRQALVHFTKQVLKDYRETPLTNSLLTDINQMIDQSDNYVAFFNRFIHRLFKDSGIVLLDSHDKELRKLETAFLKQIIEKNDLINEKFLQEANQLYNQGYGEPIERSETNAHLFYHFHGARLLLEKSGPDLWQDKQAVCQFTKDELLSLVEKHPENFSNNVVTRPLMQEYLLPVLAFIGGPGEIAYWATLKEVFHLFEMKMPPIVPRITMTIVTKQVAKWLEELQVDAKNVILQGRVSGRGDLQLWDDQEQIEETLHHVLDEVEQLHQPLKDLVLSHDRGLEALAHKNELIIKNEITFLVRKIEKSVRQKYEHELLKFDLIEAFLYPNGGLQERSLNVVYYLNEHGWEFIEKLMTLPFEMNNKHKLVFLD